MGSFRHSSITFRLLDGPGNDLLTLARRARTALDAINTDYTSTVTGEQTSLFYKVAARAMPNKALSLGGGSS